VPPVSGTFMTTFAARVLAALAIVVVLTHPAHADQLAEARGHEDAGRWSLALSLYYKVLEDQPTNPSIHYHIGLLNEKIGATDRAIESYREAIRLDPNYTDARGALEGVYVARALSASRGGKSSEAIAQLEQAVAANAGSGTAHLELGRELEKAGRMDQALEHYDQAAQADPEGTTALVRAGQLRAKRGQQERAARDFAEAVRRDPRNAEAYDGLGHAYAELGRREDAIRALEQAVRFYMLAGLEDKATVVYELEGRLRAGKGPAPKDRAPSPRSPR
jgi:tetratricopeptide (TPR) repeat protein